MIGTTLSHYSVTSKVGEGGMGVVYAATDIRLGRVVAIKVLPPAAIADEERRARFIREARAASALNHPNIVTIHDIDSIDGIHFMVILEDSHRVASSACGSSSSSSRVVVP